MVFDKSYTFFRVSDISALLDESSNEYIYFLRELYWKKAEVATGLYRVQYYISWHRHVARGESLGPARINSRVDVSQNQFNGYVQELEFSEMKNEALEEQL